MNRDTPKTTIDAFEEVEVKPAGSTYAGGAPEAGEDQKTFFEENGFLVFRKVLSAGEIAELDRELDRIAGSYRSLDPVREGFSMEDPAKWPDPDRPVFRKIGGMYDHSDAFRRMCSHRTVVDFLKLFYGPVIELYRDVVMMKQGKVGREKPWHQDAVYWNYEPNEFISAMTAIDDARVENGALQVIPGSHKRGAVKHRGVELQINLTMEQQGQTTYVPLDAGDVLMFHSLLLHASEPNRSVDQRRMSIFSYMAPYFTYTGEGDPPERICI
jgi:hypothetical protein